MKNLFKSKFSLFRRECDVRIAKLFSAVSVGLARQSSFFLLLSQKKETKEKATLSRFILCCLASRATIEFTLASHKNHDLLRSSNKRLSESPAKLALLGAAERVLMMLNSQIHKHLMIDECIAQ